MTTQDKQPLFLGDLCARWRMDADQILEIALAGKLELWINFTKVLVRKAGKVDGAKKKKAQAPQFHELIELKPQAEILSQLQGRCDRLLIGAEFPCLNAKDKEVAVSNSVGEEWGETSMLGLQPTSLYARLDDVVRFERKHKIGPPPADFEEPGQRTPCCKSAAPGNGVPLPRTRNPNTRISPPDQARTARWSSRSPLANVYPPHGGAISSSVTGRCTNTCHSRNGKRTR